MSKPARYAHVTDGGLPAAVHYRYLENAVEACESSGVGYVIDTITMHVEFTTVHNAENGE